MGRDKRGVPIIPPLPNQQPLPGPPGNPVVAVCGECGSDIHQVMNYCCNNPRCPTGLGGPTCVWGK